MRMKGWQQDLLDHLVWFTLLQFDGHLTLEEAVAKVKDEIPCLTAAVSPREGLEPDGHD
jgi:hypothetical protein